MYHETKWQAVASRDAGADGAFVYAVTTTGIYCRPSCASKRPKPANVRFFDLPEAAEQAGFRACKRCRPQNAEVSDPKLQAVRGICRYLEARAERGEDGPPTLAELADQAGMSQWHLQRTFKRYLGISPRDYADAIRVDKLKSRLKAGDSVTTALYDAGYGAASRLYERAPTQLGMTPATYARGGRGADIAYAIGDSPLGLVLVAGTTSGICFLCLGDATEPLVEALRDEFPAAAIHRDDEFLAAALAATLDYVAGSLPHLDLPLDVRGTAFQYRVWQELRTIPQGETRTYSQVAAAIGRPAAVRAVARACATNPVSLAIPCHRVKRRDGHLGGYRWGIDRKRRLIETEHQAAARLEERED